MLERTELNLGMCMPGRCSGREGKDAGGGGEGGYQDWLSVPFRESYVPSHNEVHSHEYAWHFEMHTHNAHEKR